MTLILAACAADPGPEAETVSEAGGSLEVFNLQARIFCPTGTFCGYASETALVASFHRSVQEMNLENAPAGYAFRALAPIVTQDDDFSSMTGSTGTAGNGVPNSLLGQLLINQFADNQPDRITLFLMPNLNKCWNGIPCPGADDGFDGDDVIFCRPPAMATSGDPRAPEGTGSTYAHEMGHFWCLRHTFSDADPSGPYTVDHDGDDESCDTLINVQDTPADPNGQEGSDVDDDGDPVLWHEWCEKTVLSDVDASSAHPTRCSVQCFQQHPGQEITTGYSPLTENAMSYYGWDCRGPYTLGGQTHPAFTDGQVEQIHQCRVAVPMRLLLSSACAGEGDSDRDGWCDNEDACPGVRNTPTDTDFDGIPDDCDQCKNDFSTANVNSDGDLWCNEHDHCPHTSSTNNVDSDGDGLGNACDTCPNDPDPSNLDTDGDGQGNVCDSDDDNDTCADNVDQHPLKESVPIGVELRVNCNPSSVPKLASEAGNTDGDLLKDCQDLDDDNDGVPDDDDPCPRTAGSFCVFNGPTCPLNPIFTTCRDGSCNMLLLRIWSVINPDPTRAVDLRVVSVVRDEITVEPLSGRTVGDTAQVFTGSAGFFGGRALSGAIRLELVQPTSRRTVVDLASYAGSSVSVAGLSGASRLKVKLPGSSGAALAVSGVR